MSPFFSKLGSDAPIFNKLAAATRADARIFNKLARAFFALCPPPFPPFFPLFPPPSPPALPSPPPRLAPMLPLPQAPDFGNHVQQFDVDLRRSRHQTWPGNHGVCIYH